MKSDQLFDALAAFTGGTLRHRGDHYECHVACPNCKHPVKGKETHFSFSPKGGKCFACDYTARLGELAEQLGYQSSGSTSYQPTVREERPRRPPSWKKNPEYWLSQYAGALDVVTAWQQYKPVDLDTIARWRLGVGVLPPYSSACRHRRLIYPVIQGGQVVGLRGRAISCDCPKWLNASGSGPVLFNIDSVQAGDLVVVVENPVDVMLYEQWKRSMPLRQPSTAVASTAGAGTWRDEWSEALAAKGIAGVLVWLDHDLAGNGSTYHYEEMVAQWRQTHPGALHVPTPNGPKIATGLARHHVPVRCYQWPRGTPFKADMGSIFTGLDAQ